MGKTNAPSASPRRASRRAGSSFTAVAVRERHDGWTPARQHDFIAALAECGCVAEASAAVGMSAKSAYRLRARPDAVTFRQAWTIALDFAVQRIAEAVMGRALHGTVRPVFFQGEQVGERRYFDERLAMFILRTRDPVRFGAWRDRYDARQHPDGGGQLLGYALDALAAGPSGPYGLDGPDALANAVVDSALGGDPAADARLLKDPDDLALPGNRDPLDDWLSIERVLRPRPAAARRANGRCSDAETRVDKGQRRRT